MVGVERHQKGWKSSIYHNGELLSLGIFNEQEAAAEAYDRAAYVLMGCDEGRFDSPLSEDERRELDKISPEEFLQHLILSQQKARISAKKGVGFSSPFRGVTRCGERKFTAQIWLKGKHYYLGRFDSEVAAAAAYKEAKERGDVEAARADQAEGEAEAAETLLLVNDEGPAHTEGLQAVVHPTENQLAIVEALMHPTHNQLAIVHTEPEQAQRVKKKRKRATAELAMKRKRIAAEAQKEAAAGNDEGFEEADKRRNFSSRYRGVTRCGPGKWAAQIWVNRTYHYLGRYDSELEAAAAYNQAKVLADLEESGAHQTEGEAGAELSPKYAEASPVVGELHPYVDLGDVEVASGSREVEQPQRQRSSCPSCRKPSDEVLNLKKMAANAQQAAANASQRAAEAEELARNALRRQNQANVEKLVRREKALEEARAHFDAAMAAMQDEVARAKEHKRQLSFCEVECSKLRASLAASQCQLAELQGTTPQPLQKRTDSVKVLEHGFAFYKNRSANAEATVSGLRIELAKKEQELVEQDELLEKLCAEKHNLQQKLEKGDALQRMYIDEVFDVQYRNEVLEAQVAALTQKTDLQRQFQKAENRHGYSSPKGFGTRNVVPSPNFAGRNVPSPKFARLLTTPAPREQKSAASG